MSYREGLLVTALVAAAIVVASVGIALAGTSDPAPAPEYEEFEPGSTVSEPLPASGSIEPDPSTGDGNGVVVIDESNGNRFDRGDVQPLVEAFGRVGYEVRFHTRGNMSEELSDADALVVIDPGTRYRGDELDAVDEFVAGDGRLLILGEPTRITVGGGFFGGGGLTDQESELTELGAQFDVQFETRYVYDQRRSDGTYQQIIVEPHGDAALPPDGGAALDGVDEVVFGVATEVRSTDDGEPVLVTGPNARTVGQDGARRHTVGIRDGDVLAIGDASFITAGRHNVGDNDVFLESVVEFLVSGDDGTDVSVGGSDSGMAGNATDTDGTTGNATGEGGSGNTTESSMEELRT
jgi:hypothetical protein